MTVMCYFEQRELATVDDIIITFLLLNDALTLADAINWAETETDVGLLQSVMFNNWYHKLVLTTNAHVNNVQECS